MSTESGQAPRDQVMELQVPAQGTAATVTQYNFGEAKENSDVSEAAIFPNASITGAATNNRRFRVINRGTDGTGTTVVAELATASGVNPAAGDEVALTLSGTAANLEVSAGDVIGFEDGVNGTGQTHGGLTARVTLARE
jgi:hypothetical protein